MKKDFTVYHAHPDSDFVVMYGWNAQQMIWAFIPTTCLEDHFQRDSLTGYQAKLLVERNSEAFSHIVSVKYKRGEYRGHPRYGSQFPCVDITLADIETSGETMTDSILNVAATSGWMRADGRWFPA